MEGSMRSGRVVVGAMTLFWAFVLFQPPANAWERSHATTFAVLPPGSAHPEGITTDTKGNFYVATWDYDHPNHLGHLIVFSRGGKFQRRVEIAGASSRLGDLSFQESTGDLLVVDYGGKQVLKVDPMTGASSVFAGIPGEKAAPNGMTFDKKGNLYLTDSLQGTVWKTGPAGGVPTPWVKTDLLVSHGVITPLGANGLAFDRTESALFVGNTGDNTIIRVPVVNGDAGQPEVWVTGIVGPDGMFFDEEDRLWVVANRADEVVVLDKTGKAVAKLGDFEGLDEQGAPRGLLFPAEMIKIGDTLYVGNLTVDVRYFKGRVQDGISQWAAKAKAFNIVKMRIPPLPK
jgi:sugar lactone lactonase YvrE